MSATSALGLKFYEASHKYRLDGQWVKSVTTLLKDGIPKPALTYWAARTVAEFVADNQPDVESMWAKGRGPMVAYLKETPWQQRDDAALRGTEIHAIAERVVNGEEVEVPEHHRDVVEGYVAWLDAHDLEPILTERPVASRKWQYAGKFDLIARLDGQVWLLDVKTSRGVYGETALQLAAYAGAEFYIDDDGTEHDMPHIDRLGVLHAMPGETLLYPVTDPEAAWKDFLHAAFLAKGKDRIAGYLAAPIGA